MAELAELPLIDCHVHLRSPDGIPNLTEMMDQCGLTGMNVLAMPARGDQTLSQNMTALLFKLLHPGTGFAFGGIRHPKSGEVSDPLSYEQQARRCMRAGCDGIKMIEGKPTVYKRLGEPLDAADYDDLYRYLETERIPLLWHVADPETFWDPEQVPEGARERGWYYGDGTFPEKEELYGQVERVLQRFPRLRVVFAHFYFLSADLDRLAAFFGAHTHVGVDITPGTEMYWNFSRNRDRAREFFQRYRHRIFFGTDNSSGHRAPDPDEVDVAKRKVDGVRRFLETEETFEWMGGTVSGIGLDRDVVGDICSGNFRRWVGSSPRAVDRELVSAECDRLAGLAADRNERELADKLRRVQARLAELSG